MKKNLFYNKNASLRKYHTYGINAEAMYLLEVFSEEDIRSAFDFVKEKKLPFIFLGRGSNVLFKNDYFHGLVIINKMKDFVIRDTKVLAQSGVNLQLLARKSSKLDLSGFEFLIGVPGSIGGSVFMNAGVLDLEISKYLVSVEVIYPDGMKETLNKKDCDFSYRSSVFHSRGGIILNATFNLIRNKNAYKDLKQHLKNRLSLQPVEKNNSGCIFKNPTLGPSAGYLIDSCGLKGLKEGGAEISNKHANFINNFDDASYKDIMHLITKVKKEVKRKMEVDLECEVRIV